MLILLRIFFYLLVGRILIEMILSFSRSPQPPRWFMVLAETVFFVPTDPPVKLLRKIIPPLRMGNIGLDVAVLALFFIIIFLQLLVQLVFMGANL
nr:YggT family protein [Corynebacterium uropygiale]